MSKIISSATKICLLAITTALIAGLFTSHIDGKDFMTISIMVYSFYFGQKKLQQ